MITNYGSLIALVLFRIIVFLDEGSSREKYLVTIMLELYFKDKSS